MSPRHRSKKYSHLAGSNIKAFEQRGRTYYYYVMPDGTREPLAHGDEKASLEAAHALNRALRPSGSLVDKVLSAPPRRADATNPPFTQALDEFLVALSTEGLSKDYFSAQVARLEKARGAWDGMTTGEIETFHVAEFLRTLKPEPARQVRSMLDRLFRFIASRGYASLRPMADVEKPKRQKRKRARHTWDGHLAIYEASPEWLQIAINAALYSLQRRSDLVNINLERDVDLKAKTIRVLQRKTEGYDRPVYIDIEMGDTLLDTIMRSRWSGISCPYLIHCRQKIVKRKTPKPHHFAVTPDYLTRAYSKVRDTIKVYDHLPVEQRPGVHSLRALGIFMYTKAGFSDDYIMALAGHANESMKRHYFEGHEKPKPVRVGASLDINTVDMSGIDWETTLSPAMLKLADSEE